MGKTGDTINALNEYSYDNDEKAQAEKFQAAYFVKETKHKIAKGRELYYFIVCLQLFV